MRDSHAEAHRPRNYLSRHATGYARRRSEARLVPEAKLAAGLLSSVGRDSSEPLAMSTVAAASCDSKGAGEARDEKKPLKPCCACPETKKARDAW